MNDKNFRVDLHSHSIYSDGTDDPFLLLQKAYDANLQGLSITDHDSVEAYSKELFQKAKEMNLILIPGVEISSEFQGKNVHILGYNIDYEDERFNCFLKEVKEQREKRNFLIIEKLKNHGIDISIEDFKICSTLGRVHIAKFLQEKGYVKTIQEAFDKYIKDGGICYVKGERFSPNIVIDEIHKAKGKAVLAHPDTVKNYLNDLLEFNFDGIEVYYAKLVLSVEEKFLEVARKKNLLITGGSDYHGLNKKYLRLGDSWTGKEDFDKLIYGRL